MTALIVIGSILVYLGGMVVAVHRLGKERWTMAEGPGLLFGSLLWPLWLPFKPVYKALGLVWQRGHDGIPLLPPLKRSSKETQKQERFLLPECRCTGPHPAHLLPGDPPKQGPMR
jgi:hypothetical protein